MHATQVISDVLPLDKLGQLETSEVVGFVLLGEKRHEIKKGTTKIGRDPEICSIVLEHSTVSKLHSVIESEGKDDTFIYDAGSTNYTKLGKKVLKPHCRYKLEHGNIITLGSAIIQFISQFETSHNYLQFPIGRSLMNLDAFNIDDIFELETQVNSTQTNVSTTRSNHSVPNLENLITIKKQDLPSKDFITVQPSTSGVHPTSSQLVTNSIIKPCNISESNIEKHSKSMSFMKNSVFLNFPQVQHVKQVNTSPQEQLIYHLNPFENSNIFSLATQCENTIHQMQEGNENKNVENIKTEHVTPSDVIPNLNSIKNLEKTVVESLNCRNIIMETKAIVNQHNLSRRNLKKTEQYRVNIEKELELLKEDIEVSKNFHLNFFCKNAQSIVKTSNRSYEEKFLKVPEQFIETAQETNEYYELIKDDSKAQPYNVCNTKISMRANSPNQSAEALRNSDFDGNINRIETGLGEEINSMTNNDCSDKCKEPDSSLQRKRMVSSDAGASEDESFLEITIENVNESSIFNQSMDKIDSEKDSGLNIENKATHLDCLDGKTELKSIGLCKSPHEAKKTNNIEITEEVDETQIYNIFLSPAYTQKMNNRSKCSPCILSDESDSDSQDFIETQCNDSKVSRKSENITISLSPKSHSGSPQMTLTKDLNMLVSESSEDTLSDLEIIEDSPNCRSTSFIGKPLMRVTDSFTRDFPKNGVMSIDLDLETSENSDTSYIFEVDNTIEKRCDTKVECQDVADDFLVLESSSSDVTNIIDVTPPVNKEGIVHSDVPTLTSPNAAREPIEYCDNSSTFDWNLHNKSSDPDFSSPEKHKIIECKVQKISKQKNAAEEDNQETFIKVNTSKSNSATRQYDLRLRKSDRISVKEEFSYKRTRDRKNTADVIPSKKLRNSVENFNCISEQPQSKSTEKQLLKLCRIHNISDIQGKRTRGCKNFQGEDVHTDSSNLRKSSASTSEINSYNKCETDGSHKKVLPENVVIEKKKHTGHSFKDTCIQYSTAENNQSGSFQLPSSKTRSRRKLIMGSENDEDSYFSNVAVKIVFTGFDSISLEQLIYDLGGEKTENLHFGHVLVTDQVRRTVKFLCAIGLALPITSPEWLLSCKRANKFLNPWKYLLKNEESEKKWDFNLKSSLEKAKNKKLLEGFYVFATESVKPPVADLLTIAECSGAVPLYTRPESWTKHTIVISCLEDKKSWPPSKFKSVKIVHYEFILSGVLQQAIDFKTYKLR